MSEAREGEILILHASVGGGHAAAARALAAGLAEVAPLEAGAAARVRVVDALDHMTPLFRRLYRESFEASVGGAPGAYGAAFALTRDVDRSPALRALRAATNHVHGRGLEALLAPADGAVGPRAVVCTHFLPLEVALRLRARGRLDAPVAAVVTDYVAHGLWRAPTADRTFCAPGRARHDLRRGGVPDRRILRTGIPVLPACAEPVPPPLAKLRCGLPLDRPTVLVLAGGAGMGPLVRVLEETARAVGDRAQVVVVCGRNEGLLARARAAAGDLARQGLGGPAGPRVHGFVDLLEWLRAADVVVTKPGGLTTSECFALGKATVFYEAAPGQERANARHAVALGAGVFAPTPAEAGAAAARLVRDPLARGLLEAGARRAGRPHAALDVAREVLALADAWALRRARRPRVGRPCAA